VITTRSLLSINNNFSRPFMTKPLKIVLAEDDVDDQEIFNDALLQIDIPFELTILEDGQKLLEKLRSEDIKDVDLIVLDQNMPKRNGIECLRELRKDENYKDIHCVILTTTSNEDLIQEAYKAGVNQFFTKPHNFKDYVKVIRQLVGMETVL
jgi:CheY-like chemotaxis protein